MSENVPRLLADLGLAGLARRLRLVGYDCALPREGTPNARLTVRAKDEGRLLLTTSAELAAAVGVEGAIVIAEPDVNDQVRRVYERAPIDWRRYAFSRCSRCNAELEGRAYEAVKEALPPRVRERCSPAAGEGAAPVKQCPVCGRLYWPGDHTARLLKLFDEFLK